MWRLMVVDDEPRQRRGLARMVRSLRPDWEVLEAGNGQEGLELAHRERPHAVLTDIRMPILDGLAMVERLREELPKLVACFVSAYEDFQYAAQAIRLSAVDYLIKPYTAEQVESALGSMERRLMRTQEGERMHRQLGDTLSAWREQLVQALITRPITEEERAGIDGFLDLSAPGLAVAVMALGEDPEDYLPEERAELHETIKRWLRGALPGMCPCELAGERSGVAGLVPLGALDGAEAMARLGQLERDLNTGYAMRFVVAVSEPAGALEEARALYRQAMYALSFRFYHPEGGLIAYRAVKEARTQELPYLFRHEQALLKKLEEVSEEGLDEAVHALFCALGERRIAPEKLMRRVYQVAQGLIGALENRLPGPVFEQLWADCAAVFSEMKSFRQLEEDFCQLMHAAVIVQTMDKGERTENHIKACIRYVNEHLREPISLGELAERFYFSPNYLSAMIKSRTGFAFKQYLQRLRMERACALLEDTDLKVADIAQAVGVSDPAYFNRIFKKSYGVSPDGYRRNVKARS